MTFCKNIDFRFEKKAKKLDVYKSIDSNECSPLSTDTFTDQKPPKKPSWTFFFWQTFGKKLLSFPYIWTGRIGKVLSPSGVFFFSRKSLKAKVTRSVLHQGTEVITVNGYAAQSRREWLSCLNKTFHCSYVLSINNCWGDSFTCYGNNCNCCGEIRTVVVTIEIVTQTILVCWGHAYMNIFIISSVKD